MATEAQKRAKKAYRQRKRESGKYKAVLVEFYESDMELYEHAQNNKPVATFVKELIREHKEEQKCNTQQS